MASSPIQLQAIMELLAKANKTCVSFSWHKLGNIGCDLASQPVKLRSIAFGWL